MSGRIRTSLIGLLILGCSLLFCIPAEAQTKKIEGWANVPGGTVWLEPGTQAYEHDTGLVRDLRTGQKFTPITPANHMIPMAPAPMAPVAPINLSCPTCPNQPRPYTPNPYLPSPYYVPVPPTYGPSLYDLGPNNVYGRGVNGYGLSGYGAKLGAPGAISQRWPTAKLPR